MQRHANAPDTEPEESNFVLPSNKEHLLQISDIYDIDNNPHGLGLDENTLSVKCEVVDGEEEGRTLLHRVNTNDQLKSFYYCRLFLKALGEPYKGKFDINPDEWQARQFYATTIIDGKYCNIDTYSEDKNPIQKKDTVDWPDKEEQPNL